MKYAKLLSHTLTCMPEAFQCECIDYKQWKKDLKTCIETAQDAIARLEAACDDVECMFLSNYKRVHRTWLNFWCCKNRPTMVDLDLYAQTNSMTVYKILQKDLPTVQ